MWPTIGVRQLSYVKTTMTSNARSLYSKRNFRTRVATIGIWREELQHSKIMKPVTKICKLIMTL